ncbi:hypothetical protein HK101_006883, partial [Irineochytrium annulatum]
HAAQKYVEGLANSSGNKSEEELWALGRLECLNKLEKWDDVLLSVQADFDNVEQIWEDSKRDNYLKYFVRANLKKWRDVSE